MKSIAIIFIFWIVLPAFAQDPAKEPEETKSTPSSSAYPSEPVSLYRESYLLLGEDSSALNHGSVLKFQVSAKAKTFFKGVYLGYTQRSYMDLTADSFPFYDHAFAPEIFYRPEWLSFDFVEYMQVGLLHESNGKAGLDSRSWNRIYLETYLFTGHFYFRPMVWFPFLMDDFSVLTTPYGYGELTFGFKTHQDIELSLRGRVGKKFDKGSGLFNFSLPLSVFDKSETKPSNSQIWVQAWYGQGETLLGMNERSFSVAVGMGFRSLTKKNIKKIQEDYQRYRQ